MQIWGTVKYESVGLGPSGRWMKQGLQVCQSSSCLLNKSKKVPNFPTHRLPVLLISRCLQREPWLTFAELVRIKTHITVPGSKDHF